MKQGKSFYEDVIKSAEKEKQKRGILDIQGAIREIRKEKGLSGSKVCEHSGGLDPRTLTAVEKGRIKNPSLQTLSLIAEGLGVEVSEIFRKAEMVQERTFYQGTQKGAFQLDLTRFGVRVISFTPLQASFFCGKLIMSARRSLDCQALQHPYPMFFSVIVGKFEIQVENQRKTLREGDNLLFNGSFQHTITNSQQRDSTILLVTSPSFL